MPPKPRKVITVIVAEENQERVVAGLKASGAHDFTFCFVKGQGTHGRRVGGMFGAENVMTTVVTSAEVAEKVLRWFERELMVHATGIIYVMDGAAIFSSQDKGSEPL